MRVALYMKSNNPVYADAMKELDDQLQSMWRYCREQGWDVVDYYPNDSKRKCLDSLMRNARLGTFDIVLVTNPTVLSNNLDELARLVGTLEDSGVRLRFAENAKAVGFVLG
jgi:DNA invertase Pin-like site-specific DNA recombinase